MTTSQPLRIGVVLSTGEWWSRLHAYAADHSSTIEIAIVRDAQAVFDSGLRILCTDDSVLWVTKALVTRAVAAGIVVVGIRSAGNSRSDGRLAELGIENRANDTVAPAGMLELLARLRPPDEFDEIVARLDRVEAVGEAPVVVVGGPPGAGAREVAIGVCAALGVRRSTVLVDCSESSPGVARRLGLQLQPHILDAFAATASGSLREAIAEGAPALTRRPLPFDVICGLASPSDWPRLTPDVVDAVVTGCRVEWSMTVAVTSPVVEDLGRWVNRYAASRHLLATSRCVIGVCEPTPRGVLRFADWLADCQPTVPVRVVVNKAPKSRFVGAEVIGQLESVCGDLIGECATAPFDRRVTAAEWDASLPSKGSFTRAIAAVADELADLAPALPVGAKT